MAGRNRGRDRELLADAMYRFPRATLSVVCVAAVAVLATTSTAAEILPSGGAPLARIAPTATSSAAPAGTAAPTGAAPVAGPPVPSTRATAITISPALPAPVHTQLAESIGPSGGVALLPLVHISARIAPPRSDGTRKTWTISVDGRTLTFRRLSRP